MTDHLASGSRRRVLVVDDSRIVRRIARGILEDAGFAVEEATDGADALRRTRESRPDVMLLDWNMPVMSGIDCLQAIRREFGSEAPLIIMCTTENEPGFIASALAAGAQEFIMKPFDDAILLDKFEQLRLLGSAP